MSTPSGDVDHGEALRRRAAALVTSACAARADARPSILEAGCGARSHLPLPPGVRVIGVDVAESQLRRNEETSQLVLGDAMRLPIASGSMDAAVSWDVLEHLPDPRTALAELARVVRPGGIVVLGLPNVLSLKGLVTRFTPWRVHVWVYRHVLGDMSAGTDTFDQFPTTLPFMLRPAGLAGAARALGLDVVMLDTYEGPVPRHLRRRHRSAHYVLTAAGAVSRLVSLGHYDATASDIVAVLRRPEPGSA